MWTHLWKWGAVEGQRLEGQPKALPDLAPLPSPALNIASQTLWLRDLFQVAAEPNEGLPGCGTVRGGARTAMRSSGHVPTSGTALLLDGRSKFRLRAGRRLKCHKHAAAFGERSWPRQ